MDRKKACELVDYKQYRKKLESVVRQQTRSTRTDKFCVAFSNSKCLPGAYPIKAIPLCTVYKMESEFQ